MAWWLWMALGLGLIALELATPGGFFIIFFGVAALIVGALVPVAAPQAWAQWLLFPVLALVALRFFRRPLLDRMRSRDRGADDVDSVVGSVAVAAEPMAPGAIGHAELRGTPWTARNVGHISIDPGQRCRVVAVQGLTLDLVRTE